MGSTARPVERETPVDFALVRGRLTAYRLLGSPGAPVVLLLHGLGAAGNAYDAVASRLAADYRLIVPDLLGSGRTAKPLIDYRPDELANHLDGLLKSLGVTDLAAVVGHSQGAAVAVELCSLRARQPATAIEKLVLIDPPPPAGVRWLRPVTGMPLGARSAEIFSALLPHRSLARLWLGFLFADRSRVTDHLLAGYTATSGGRGYAAATARALHSLARLQLPLEAAPSTLLLWGSEYIPPKVVVYNHFPALSCPPIPKLKHANEFFR